MRIALFCIILCTCIWNLKAMPVNNEGCSLVNTKYGKKFWHLKPHLITFLVFNILETWRRYKLMINIGIVKFLKQFIERFLNNREICRRGPNYIQKTAAERSLIKFLFLAIGQSNPPLFSYKVSNGIKPLRDETAFPYLIIFFKY